MDFTSTLQLFCVENGFKRHLRFENWQICSLCKMLSLGQKFKLKKKNMWRTTLEAHYSVSVQKMALKKTIIEKWQVFENGQNWSQCIRVVLCKKRLQKTPYIPKMTIKFSRIAKNCSPCMGYSLCKMLSLGLKLKF